MPEQNDRVEHREIETHQRQHDGRQIIYQWRHFFRGISFISKHMGIIVELHDWPPNVLVDMESIYAFSC